MSPSKLDLADSGLVSLADVVHLQDRPLPTAPDGQYDYAVAASGDPNGRNDQHSRLYSLADTIDQIAQRGPPVTDPKFVGAILDEIRNPNAVDDRKNIFVDSLAAITKIPAGDVETKLNNEAITLLYDTLPHPPATFLGYQAQFRAADGGGNSLQSPDLGRAGQPYARSVQGKHPQPWNVMPDPGLVFDELLKADNVRRNALSFVLSSSTCVVPTAPWRKLFSYIRLCVPRNALALPHRSPERMDQQHVVVPRSFSLVRRQPSRARLCSRQGPRSRSDVQRLLR